MCALPDAGGCGEIEVLSWMQCSYSGDRGVVDYLCIYTVVDDDWLREWRGTCIHVWRRWPIGFTGCELIVLSTFLGDWTNNALRTDDAIVIWIMTRWFLKTVVLVLLHPREIFVCFVSGAIQLWICTFKNMLLYCSVSICNISYALRWFISICFQRNYISTRTPNMVYGMCRWSLHWDIPCVGIFGCMGGVIACGFVLGALICG